LCANGIPSHQLFSPHFCIVGNMKISVLPILALVTAALAVTQPQKAVIVSYPDETPDSVVEQAKDAIKAAGGFITHEYKLIK
jgi:hypothetical protein